MARKSDYGLLMIYIFNTIISAYLGFLMPTVAWMCCVFLQGRIILMLNDNEDETPR
jgi:hypothetical protein